MARRALIRTEVAPLSCWLLALLFFAAASISFVWIAGRVDLPPSEAFTAYNRARLAQLGLSKRRARIVMLGNSRLKYATLSEEKLARRIGPNVDVIRIVNNWAVFTDFEPLLEQIVDLAPNLIVLQDDLFSTEWSHINKVRHVLEYVRWAISGNDIWNPGHLDHYALQFDTPCAGDVTEQATQQRLKRTEAWLTLNSEGDDASNARHFVAQAHSTATDIVVLSIPRSSYMEVARPRKELLASLAERLPGVEIWEPAEPLADDLFCDTVHLNERGREYFSAWLVSKLHGSL